MTDVARFAAIVGGVAVVTMKDVHLQPDKLGCDLSGAVGASFRPAILDSDRAALNPAELARRRWSRDVRLQPRSRGALVAATMAFFGSML
jgi:hypothetical protein